MKEKIQLSGYVLQSGLLLLLAIIKHLLKYFIVTKNWNRFLSCSPVTRVGNYLLKMRMAVFPCWILKMMKFVSKLVKPWMWFQMFLKASFLTVFQVLIIVLYFQCLEVLNLDSSFINSSGGQEESSMSTSITSSLADEIENIIERAIKD